MIAKRYRFFAADFKRKPARIIRGTFFTVKLFPKSGPYPRFGAVVSKNVSAKAVSRNRLRRRIYEVFRTTAQNIPANYDILVIALRPAGKLSVKDARAELQAMFSGRR